MFHYISFHTVIFSKLYLILNNIPIFCNTEWILTLKYYMSGYTAAGRWQVKFTRNRFRYSYIEPALSNSSTFEPCDLNSNAMTLLFTHVRLVSCYLHCKSHAHGHRSWNCPYIPMIHTNERVAENSISMRWMVGGTEVEMYARYSKTEILVCQLFSWWIIMSRNSSDSISRTHDHRITYYISLGR